MTPWRLTRTDSAEEWEYEERVGAPAGRLLDLAAARQPGLGLRLVTALDGERGESFVAREQELRLAHGLRDAQRTLTTRRAAASNAGRDRM